jgi:hypothetical protein
VSEDDDWSRVWNARESALTPLLGAPGDTVFHATIPFEFRDAGGSADVVPFPHFVSGMTYVTCELTGSDVGQLPSSLGQYELMICTKGESPMAADFIARLACYTCDAVIEAGETMDIGEFFEDTSLRAMLFAHPIEPSARFRVLDQDCGLLLCVGITEDELEFAKGHGRDRLLELLKEHNVFPYTIPDRASTPLPSTKSKSSFWRF